MSHISPKNYNAIKELIVESHNGIADNYEVGTDGKTYLKVKFQTGGTATTEKNGVFIEDLLIIAYAKLKEYNDQLPCRENSIALTKIEEAVLWLAKRKLEREFRGVYGTEQK